MLLGLKVKSLITKSWLSLSLSPIVFEEKKGVEDAVVMERVL